VDLVTMSLRLVGGASLPRSVGTVSATWPLAVLTTGDEGISVDLRPAFVKRTVAKSPTDAPAGWSIAWSDLASVDFGRRSVVIRPQHGKGCRFVTLTRRRILPLIDQLEHHGVVITRKTSTIGWFAKG